MDRINEKIHIHKGYLRDGYSGAQVRVFFGDILMDDIVALSWNASNQKTPLYGYNSSSYDAVANGVFIVEGSFSVVFTETAKMELIRRALRGEFTNERYTVNVYGEKEVNKGRYIEGEYNLYGNVPRPTPAVGYTESAPGGVKSPVAYMKRIEDILRNENWSLSVYEDMAERMEDFLWGGKIFRAVEKESLATWDKNIARLRRVDEHDLEYDPIRDVRRILVGDGNVFNIILLYGDVNDPASEHTVKTIYDVHITGSSQELITDDVVIETYSFFARDADAAIGHLVLPQISEDLRGLTDIPFKVGEKRKKISKGEKLQVDISLHVEEDPTNADKNTITKGTFIFSGYEGIVFRGGEDIISIEEFSSRMDTYINNGGLKSFAASANITIYDDPIYRVHIRIYKAFSGTPSEITIYEKDFMVVNGNIVTSTPTGG